MSNFHSTLSRRDFLKAAGIGGAGVAAAAGTFGWAYATGSHAFTHSGWENRQGYEYFDRTPFEVDEVPETSWKVIGPDLGGIKSYGGIHRPDMRTAFANRFKSASFFRYKPELGYLDCIPDVWPSNGVAGLDPFWQEYYEMYPMMLERDKEYKYEWLPGQIERHAATQEARAEFATNEAYLANARADSHRAVSVSKISDPPEVSDWKDVRPTRAVFNSPDDAAKLIKRMAHELGAVIVRIAKLNPAWVYLSNPRDTRGFKANVPIEVPAWWEYAIIVTGTHNFKPMYSDPNYGTSWDGYNWSSQTAQQLVYFIKRMGYPARWHSPFGGYDLCVPPISQESGMGQVGRASFTITPEFGGSFRPAVITTSLPMTVDKPLDFNLAKFCSRCKLCAEVCPTEAISYADEPDFEVRGLRRWYINYLKCRDGWNLVSGPMGCRACVSICPWSRVNNWVHRFVRAVVPNDPTGITQSLSVWAEKNIFGPKNMGEVLLPPTFKGVMDPPEWLVTDNYISGFTNTPMGVK